MLRKLIKYEFKATARIFLPLFLAMLFLALLNGLFMGPNVGGENSVITTLRSILLFVYIVVIFSLFIVTLVITIQRFYKNLTGDEGYLMFTLPVKTSSLICSKLIVAVIWELFSILVTLASVFLLFLRESRFYGEFWEGFSRFWEESRRLFGTSFEAFLWLAAASVLIAAVVSILQIYTAIAISQLFREHRALIAIGSYFGISIVIQIVSSMLFMTSFLSRIDGLVSSVEITAEGAAGVAPVFELINAVMPGMMILDAVVGVAFFLVTNYIFKKRLNLE